MLSRNLVFIKLLILLLIILSFSCKQEIKTDTDANFERQISPLSTDEMLIGDDLNYWNVDSPKGAIFILNSKTDLLKGFGIKPISFKENDKTNDELSKQINTSPIYQLEVYELPTLPNLSGVNPHICDFINNNFSKATLLTKLDSISFRVKERNWVWVNSKIDKGYFVFVRLAVADRFSVIKNNASDSLIIMAKRNEKALEEFTQYDYKKILSWSCQETNYIDVNSLEPIYYNPDIVFNFN